MSDKYGVGQDIYCYPNSQVLVNLLEITDGEILNSAEVEFTKFRLEQYEFPAFREFSYQTLANIHFYLFQDVYAWAGEVRTVDISKGATRFATCARILPEAEKLFNALRDERELRGLNHVEFVSRMVHYFSELNVIHPFRDGNGRAQRLLFELIAINAGYQVRWQLIDRSEWVPANIAAFNFQFEPLFSLLSHAVSEIDRKP